MGKGKLASLIGLGLLLGFSAFEMRQSARESNDLIAGNQKFLYDNCLKSNAATKDILPADQQRDCAAEFIDQKR